jgi:hypothetical protein
MKKHCNSKHLACQGFVALFCRGDKQSQCVRKQFKQQHGYPPSDDMMPNGQMMTA